jgi:hypothetical protein
MWLTELLSPGKGEVCTLYHEGSLSPDKTLEMYVCTYAVEYLVLQTVAYKQRGFGAATPKNRFPAIPFWPEIPRGFVWPPSDVLRTVEDFNAFTDRWQEVDTVTAGGPAFPTP